jgi:hypothetical protein
MPPLLEFQGAIYKTSNYKECSALKADYCLFSIALQLQALGLPLLCLLAAPLRTLR